MRQRIANRSFGEDHFIIPQSYKPHGPARHRAKYLDNIISWTEVRKINFGLTVRLNPRIKHLGLKKNFRRFGKILCHIYRNARRSANLLPGLFPIGKETCYAFVGQDMVEERFDHGGWCGHDVGPNLR
jgi:hypothetical protein